MREPLPRDANAGPVVELASSDDASVPGLDNRLLDLEKAHAVVGRARSNDLGRVRMRSGALPFVANPVERQAGRRPAVEPDAAEDVTELGDFRRLERVSGGVARSEIGRVEQAAGRWQLGFGPD